MVDALLMKTTSFLNMIVKRNVVVSNEQLIKYLKLLIDCYPMCTPEYCAVNRRGTCSM